MAFTPRSLDAAAVFASSAVDTLSKDV